MNKLYTIRDLQANAHRVARKTDTFSLEYPGRLPALRPHTLCAGVIAHTTQYAEAISDPHVYDTSSIHRGAGLNLVRV